MDEIGSKLMKLPESQGKTPISTDGVKGAVAHILEPTYGNSPNFIIGKRLLKEKLESGNTTQIASLLMEILTSRPEFLKDKYEKNDPDFLLKLKDQTKQQSEYYKKVLGEMEKLCQKTGILETADNPAWFSLKTKNKVNIPNGSNYKLYLTIPINGYDYVSKIYQLGVMLHTLAQRTSDKISVKIPHSLLGFLSHSDSVVIHFKNRQNKESIEKILSEWKAKNGITEENRNLGRTKFAGDSTENSFSGIVAENIEKWVLKNYGKYDHDLIAKLAIEYAIQQSQVPPNFL